MSRRYPVHGIDTDNPITPKMKGYKMSCCDCGLVHEIDFKVIRVTKELEGGYFEYEEVNDPSLRIAMDVERNNRSTAQIRRYKKK